MIALKSELPLVRFECGRVVDFENGWLQTELVRAAERAGYSKWWLAEHVTESVAAYLRYQCSDPIVGVERLSKAVRSVLHVIGYAEVADHFQGAPPPNEIWLPELSREAGAGFELAFFELLKRRIDTLAEDGPGEWSFSGLQPCVKMLQSAKTWSRECTRLSEEIVEFIRTHATRERPDGTAVSIMVR